MTGEASATALAQGELLALALFHCGVLSGPGAHEIRRGCDTSPAGADRVSAVIPPYPAKSGVEPHHRKIGARRRRRSKTDNQYANGKSKTLQCKLPCCAFPELSDSTCSILGQARRALLNTLMNKCVARRDSNRGINAGSRRLFVGGSHARTKTRSREGHYASCRQERRHDRVTVSLVETPKTSKAKGGVLFSEMPGR
jgi:hypothetical protein